MLTARQRKEPCSLRGDRPEVKELRGFELTGTNIPNFYPWHILMKMTTRSMQGRMFLKSGYLTEPVSLSQVLFINIFPGGYSLEETPDPFPNSAVKLQDANGTAGATPWESQSPPGL